MSLGACIDELVEQGALSAAQGARAREVYGEIRARRAKEMGPAAAEAKASEEAIRALEVEAAQSARVKLLQIDAQARAIRDTAGYDDGKGGKPGAAAAALLDQDGKATYANVEMLRRAIVGRAHARMEAVLRTFRRDIMGRMPKAAEMRDVIRELFGDDTGNASAKELAAAWRETAEELRQRFNDAGGRIGHLVDWGMPQSHDGAKLREAGFEVWRDHILPRLDRLRMQDEATGLPFSDAKLEAVLKNVFDTITTDGWIGREPGGAGGGKMLANERAEHRFLTFKDADAWMEYRDAFGAGGTPFDAMIAHVDDMARDIAHMERLGPNPNATIGWLQDGIVREGALRGDRDGWFTSAKGGAEALGRLYDVTSGRTAIPVNEKWATSLGGARSFLVAAKLGGASISALSDTGFQIVTRAFNGMPVWRAVTDHLRMMASGEHRQAAVRLGLIAEEAGKRAATLNRYVGESVGPGVAARLADAELRMTGLSAWTQTGKWAYAMGQLSHLTGQADRAFDALGGRTRASLERYGIDARQWDAIRSAERMEVRGADFLDPLKVADRAVGDRLLRMIQSETMYAVPEVTARARAMMSFGQPGTLVGEVGRSMVQFRSFGVSMLLTHGSRMVGLGKYNGALYGAGLFLTTTMFGALSLQLKELVKGRGLRPMDDWTFWRDASLQAGGFGIFGDFMQSQVIQALDANSGSARLQSTGELVAGPLASAATDAIRFGIAPIQDWNAERQGKPARYQARTDAQLLRGYFPLLSSAWYTRAAFEHLVVNTAQGWEDPYAERSWAMMEESAARKGQSYWWHPGQTLPSDAPDLAAGLNAPPDPDAG